MACDLQLFDEVLSTSERSDCIPLSFSDSSATISLCPRLMAVVRSLVVSMIASCKLSIESNPQGPSNAATESVESAGHSVGVGREITKAREIK